VFGVTDRKWRDIGVIHQALSAERACRFRRRVAISDTPQKCPNRLSRSGQILQGLKPPGVAFRTLCTPQSPLGATMVSSEGACAAYYHYGRKQLMEGSSRA
jgi:hydrogenase expression/formation protein HypD